MVAPDVPYRIHWVRHFDFATLNPAIFTFPRALELLLEKRRFDVVHGNGEEAFFFDRVCRQAGARFFYTSHAPFIPRQGFFKSLANPVSLLKTLNPHLMRQAIQRADQVIVFSEFSKSLIVDALGPASAERIELVSPGVEPSWFEVNRNGDTANDFIFWGRLEAEKGLPELIDAFSAISKENDSARLHLVGEGNYETASRERVAALGLQDRVYYHGWMQTCQIKELASQCRYGVFPSRIESFGLAVAEAQAAGLPSIATRAGALPEFIEDNVNGLLVAPQDAASLAAAMQKALREPETMERLGASAREQAKERFNWDRAAQRILELYRASL